MSMIRCCRSIAGASNPRRHQYASKSARLTGTTTTTVDRRDSGRLNSTLVACPAASHR
jgi:hypothetical protein